MARRQRFSGANGQNQHGEICPEISPLKTEKASGLGYDGGSVSIAMRMDDDGFFRFHEDADDADR